MEDRFVGTMPVREQHVIDVKKLEEYMAANVSGFSGGLVVKQFKGGQSNPTYKLEAREANYVLRRKPPGKLLPSAHAVDREYRIITALQDTDVPVAKTYCLCEDDSVIGTMFYIMECVEGRVLWDQTLPNVDYAKRKPIYEELNRVIAALHTVDYSKLGLEDFGRPGNYIERQISRWTKQYQASETENIPSMNKLIDWLPKNVPQDEEVSIVHGDYRLDNVIFHPTEARILAVIDWELSTLGHPLADFAYHTMTYRLKGEEFRGLGDHKISELGIPSEDDYIDMYCKKTDRKAIPNKDFYAAYNLFRLAGILQGILGRVKDGTAASKHALEQAGKPRALSDLAWSIVEESFGAV